MTREFFYEANPPMFKNSPLGFIISIGLIPFAGIGILILLFWLLNSRATKLRIVGNEITLEKGLLNKSRTDLEVKKIRTIKVDQSFFQRVFDVGNIQVFTAGDKAELTLNGMPEPNKIRDYVKRHNSMDT